MDVNQTEEFIISLSKSMGAMDQDSADRIRALASADDLSLFWIVNTSGRKEYFLARSSRFARHLAVRCGHIQDVNNGECFKASDKFFSQNPGFGSSVKRAIADYIPGPIEPKGNHAVMGDRVYSPLTEVK